MSEMRAKDFMAPYINLADVRVAPMHALALAYRANSTSGQVLPPVPAQIVQPASFRATLAAQVRPTVCPVDDPESLPAELRTPAWCRMVTAIRSQNGDADRVWAADLLFRLGFYRAYLAARAQWPKPEDIRWASFLDVLDWLARRRVAQGDDQLRSALYSMVQDEGIWPAARLFAAATLMVGAATTRPVDVDFVHKVFKATEPTALALERTTLGGPDSLFLSTYWRGASFVPHLTGDTQETLLWLDRSLAFACQAYGDDSISGPTAGMTKYPVLETRARVLRSAGRAEEALHELRTLSALDPFDARVFLKLGDTYTEIGRMDDADACYTRATTLGPPLAPLAHLSLARHCRRVGNLERAKLHIDAAQRLDPTLGRSAPPPARTTALRVEPRPPAPTVAPDPERAIQIQSGTTAQRERMLRHLIPRLLKLTGQESGTELQSAVARIDNLPEAARRRLLCGPSFSLWLADAVRAISSSDTAGAWPTQLATVLDDPMTPDLIDSTLAPGPAVGSGNPLLGSFIDRINAEDRARGGRGDVMISDAPDHIRMVRELLALIECSWPELDREIREVIGTVIPFQSESKTAITNASLHGLLLIRVPFEDDAIALDRFVHEAAHVLLNLGLEVHPCHDGPIGATMPSPFRAGPRPVEGVLHGVFVFARAATAVARAQGALSRPMSAVRRIQRSLTIISSGLVMLEEYGNLNEYGQSVAADVRAATRELITDFGIAQF